MKMLSVCFLGIFLLNSAIITCLGETKKINNYSEERLQIMKEHYQYTIDDNSDELSLSIHNMVDDRVEYSESKYNCNNNINNKLQDNLSNGAESRTRSNMRRNVY